MSLQSYFLASVEELLRYYGFMLPWIQFLRLSLDTSVACDLACVERVLQQGAYAVFGEPSSTSLVRGAKTMVVEQLCNLAVRGLTASVFFERKLDAFRIALNSLWMYTH
tara:strand:- start:335 stop:661 length:327 start_codon:yes stop_codon:yes gene_type:complete